MNRRLSRTTRNWTLITDLIIINLAFYLAYYARYIGAWLRPPDFDIPYSEYLQQQLLFVILLVISFAQNGLWTRRRGEFWIDEVSRIVYATATGIALHMALTFFIRPLAFSRLMLVWALLFTVGLISLARLLRRMVLSWLYRRGIGTDRALVIGSGEVGRSVIRTLLARPDLGYQTVGYLNDGFRENNIGSGRIPHLGHMSDLGPSLQKDPRVNTVFIALPGEMHHEISQLLRICQRHGVRAQVVPDLLQMSLNRVEFNAMAGIPVLGVRQIRISRWQQAMKRAIDLSIALVLALPVLLISIIIALAVKLESPGPIVFAQNRVGKDGHPFKMYKFRSMVVDAEDRKQALAELNEATGPIFKIKDDPRLTRVGRIIRRLSLDELPQLLNVLKGEMSLVGPRPPLPDEVSEYQPWHRQRLAVKGGISGLWQVSGRSDLTFDEQCLLDIYYIENWSLSLDIRIILQTIPRTIFARGAY